MSNRGRSDNEPTTEELRRRAEDAMLDYMNTLPEDERAAFAERARALWDYIERRGEEGSR